MASVLHSLHSDQFSTERMASLRIVLTNLFGLYLIISGDHSGCCLDTVWQPPRPSISHLQAVSGEQSLSVSWLVNHSGLVGVVTEIQISRTENYTVIYNENVSAPTADLNRYTWTWTSALPLECVDHSVRIRHFYNQSVPSPWSDWVTNYGVEAEDKPKIFPSERVLKEATSAMFCCVPRVGVHIAKLTFNNSVKYRLISIGARVGAIAVDNLTIPKAFINAVLLSCTDTSGRSNHTWNYVSFPPQKPRNLSCMTSDMTSVTCTWDPGRERPRYDKNSETHTLHIVNSDQAPITCEPSSCTFLVVPHLDEYNISVVVKNQLGEEMRSYSFNISDRVFPVVEWDIVSPGVTNATVSWILQGNLTQLNFLCQVATDPHGTTELSCDRHCKVTLEHLLPSTHYSTKVRCSARGRFWGKWTGPVSFTTYPLGTLNLWRRIKQLSDPNSRWVTLLWIPHISGSANMGIIQGYTIQWSQEGQNRTKWMDSGQTKAEISIGPGRCEFIVQTVLQDGLAIPARITIPEMDVKENLPVEKRLSSGIAGSFNLSWAEQVTATCGYTVEWCTLGNTAPCTLQWMRIQKGNSTLFLPGENFKAGCRYTFNIYGCTENGHRLLEIQTGYSQELNPVQSPSLVEAVQSSSSSVTLEWHYNEDDPAHPAFITGYLVIAQELGSHMLPGSAANMFRVSVEDPGRKSVTIEGLQQGREYAFSVSALTKWGPGQPASITARTKTNYSAYLAKILTPIFLVLGCTILLWPQRKMLKEMFAYPAGMSIKTSELETFLNQAGVSVQSHKVEDCISCDIEILDTHPPLNETTTLTDPEPLTAPPPSPSSLSSTSCHFPVCHPKQSTAQSATMLCDTPPLRMQQVLLIRHQKISGE
uniref:leukemia inhibitory factor receptor isoform X2 n=1 Tax=Monopterus albus TaxID=43700 RepID=UPI0009B3A258|nr:leukemia inhibitory factor receptor-like isoform X2 [Monopterus albus]XP_020449372.1 leukemia inhibitory factor receptor-like isoform X2 [Monopterus albus]